MVLNVIDAKPPDLHSGQVEVIKALNENRHVMLYVVEDGVNLHYLLLQH